MSATLEPLPPQAPIATLGPCGSGFLSVDPTMEQALEHLSGHLAEQTAPGQGTLTFFDGLARELRLDEDGGLVVTDGEVREGELRARITEALAHAREHLYRDPSLMQDSGLRDPADCRPPSDDLELADFLISLSYVLAAEPPVQRHVGSWWHNLLHRLG
ncbi:MAG: hypothetical protein ACR2MA_12555 [Egibacteraceae bacterium]